jgi:hypothetical protein
MTYNDRIYKCAIPVFDGLLSGENNGILLDLLFELATWHGFAKLRLHTESTLMALEGSTTRLGAIFRKFVKTTCAGFDTRDLPSEEAARGRRKAAMALKKGSMTSSSGTKGKQRQDDNTHPVTRQRRKFILNTYKAHALGDYPAMIRLFGACDGYSTQTVMSFLLSIILCRLISFRANLNIAVASVSTLVSTKDCNTMLKALQVMFLVNAFLILCQSNRIFKWTGRLRNGS